MFFLIFLKPASCLCLRIKAKNHLTIPFKSRINKENHFQKLVSITCIALLGLYILFSKNPSYSETFFSQSLLHMAPVFFVAISPEGKTLSVNETMLRALGYASEEVIGKEYMTTFVPEDDWGKLSIIFAKLIRMKIPTMNENYVLSKDGRKILVEWHGRSIFNQKGEVDYFVGLGIDITQRRQAEKKLLESEKRFRELTDMLPETIFEMDLSGHLTFVNQNAFDLMGFTREDLEHGINIFDLIHEKDRHRAKQNINKILAGENPGVTEYEIARKDGCFSPYLCHSSPILRDQAPIGLRGFLIDITEKKHTQELLIQNEKMLSIGGLAAGMAHEINNPLAGMMQNAQVVLNRISSDLEADKKAAEEAGTSIEAIRRYMEKRDILQLLRYVVSSGAQAAKIVRSMMNFAQKQAMEKIPQDLVLVLEKALELMKNDFSLEKSYDFNEIRIIRDYDPNLPEAPCMATQIRQVVMNVIKNSMDAALGAGQKLSDLVLHIRLSLENGMAQIEIADNGPGMDHNTQKRIFEPFFTTKPVDKGSGLGLSISYFIIVDKHHGEMEVESSPGKGTKFIIRLPLNGENECQMI